jgi:hypothetical protein
MTVPARLPRPDIKAWLSASRSNLVQFEELRRNRAEGAFDATIPAAAITTAVCPA